MSEVTKCSWIYVSLILLTGVLVGFMWGTQPQFDVEESCFYGFQVNYNCFTDNNGTLRPVVIDDIKYWHCQMEDNFYYVKAC